MFSDCRCSRTIGLIELVAQKDVKKRVNRCHSYLGRCQTINESGYLLVHHIPFKNMFRCDPIKYTRMRLALPQMRELSEKSSVWWLREENKRIASSTHTSFCLDNHFHSYSLTRVCASLGLTVLYYLKQNALTYKTLELFHLSRACYVNFSDICASIYKCNKQQTRNGKKQAIKSRLVWNKEKLVFIVTLFCYSLPNCYRNRFNNPSKRIVCFLVTELRSLRKNCFVFFALMDLITQSDERDCSFTQGDTVF